MSIAISPALVTAALADYLSPLFPGVTLYANPTQQTPTLPALFITPSPSKLIRWLGRWRRDDTYILTYVIPYNQTDNTDQLLAAQQILDTHLEYLPFSTTYLKAHRRESTFLRGSLVYRVTFKPYLTFPLPDDALLETMTLIQHPEAPPQ
jgi:hypothetical protein